MLALQDEAFALWTEEWGSLYAQGSRSRTVIEDIANSWCAPTPASAERARVPCTAHCIMLNACEQKPWPRSEAALSDVFAALSAPCSHYVAMCTVDTGGASSASVAYCERGTAPE